MPVHNAAGSLPMALGSVLAQTFEDWECLVVDDGSNDHSGDIAEKVPDGRITVFRLHTQRGRGFARQRALESALGEFLCMLDADDWLYPEKLRIQVCAMQTLPEAALVSNPMAVTGPGNVLMGVRPRISAARPKINPPLGRPVRPPLPFPASMIRMEAAKKTGFDLRFIRSEDADFLLRLLINRSWAMLPDPVYAYTENPSGVLKQTTLSYRFERRMLRKHLASFPCRCRLRTGENLLKTFLVIALFSMGFGKRLVKRRSSPPNPSDKALFIEAKQRVEDRCRELFGPSHLSGVSG
jgi:glycosyltransferase involved in cell wall biosynthesis